MAAFGGGLVSTAAPNRVASETGTECGCCGPRRAGSHFPRPQTPRSEHPKIPKYARRAGGHRAGSRALYAIVPRSRTHRTPNRLPERPVRAPWAENGSLAFCVAAGGGQHGLPLRAGPGQPCCWPVPLGRCRSMASPVWSGSLVVVWREENCGFNTQKLWFQHMRTVVSACLPGSLGLRAIGGHTASGACTNERICGPGRR